MIYCGKVVIPAGTEWLLWWSSQWLIQESGLFFISIQRNEV